MSLVHLYRIPQVVELTAGIGVNLMNYPINRADFTLFRYADNDIDFLIKDFDRQVVTMAGCSATITIIDTRQQRLLMARDLILADATQGHFKLFITGEEAASFPKRDLRYTVMMTRTDAAQVMLFTDKNKKSDGVIHVEDGPLPMVVEPVRLRPNDFLTRAMGLGKVRTLYAGSFASAKTVGNDTGIHSLSIEFIDDFSGKVFIEGSRNTSAAQDDSDWFIIHEESFTLKTGTEYIPFTNAEVMWVRFRIEPRRGTFDEVVYRNA